jgi:hypothetical protein
MKHEPLKKWLKMQKKKKEEKEKRKKKILEEQEEKDIHNQHSHIHPPSLQTF